MVLFDISKETATPLSASSSNTTPTDETQDILSFSALLKGQTATDTKVIEKNSLFLALNDENMTELESLELDAQITENMNPQELKVTINEAKEFLKNKITQSEGFKKAEIETLPKTLNGLVQAAKKIGIDVSKITLEEVQQQQMQKSDKPNNTQSLHLNTQINADKKSTENEQKYTKSYEEMVEKHNNKTTPLFKTRTTPTNPEITTQQIVNTKINNLSSQQNTKQKTNDTLELLLQGEKASKNDTGLKVDFSTATARVIAPQATKKPENSLASLLKNDTSDTEDIQSKTDGLNIAKADSLEVKLNEAKQMVKYLSQDVKSAIEDYKSPFTRVKVQLNPQKLGEVDVTIVQRGKNLHVNVSSNNAAINTLAMNANDLKVQLQNNGIQNASLNFSNNSQSGEFANGGQTQQDHQQRQSAQDEYNYFDTEEKNEEILSSLEIIVPNYA